MANEEYDTQYVKMTLAEYYGKFEYETAKDSYYHCVFCEDRGEPNARATMAFSKVKSIGTCPRCNTVVITEVESIHEDSSFQQEFDKVLDELSLALNPLVESIVYNDVDLTQFPYVNSQSVIDYLQFRLPNIDINTILALNLREYVNPNGGRRGVLFPVIMYATDKCVSYVVRYIGGRFRYLNLPGSKYPYMPTTIPKHSIITICEGVFDAVALRLMGYYPLALLGSSLYKGSVNVIRKLLPAEVYIAMDTIELNNMVSKQVRHKLPTVENVTILTFGGTDPADYYRSTQLGVS